MSDASIKAQRAKFLVEAFLDDLQPSRFVEAESENLDFDFVVAFKKSDGGLKYCAVEVKHTDKPPQERFNFMTGRRFLEASKSNMPTAILIADTKHNQLYYGFASRARIVNTAHRAGFYEVTIPVKKTGSTPNQKREFLADVIHAT